MHAVLLSEGIVDSEFGLGVDTAIQTGRAKYEIILQRDALDILDVVWRASVLRRRYE